VRKEHVLRQEISGVNFSWFLKYRIFEGLYANFSDFYFISSLNLFHSNRIFRFYLMQGLLENFSLIEFASFFVCASPTKILFHQFLCFLLRWIKFCPTIRFVIHLPIWT